MSPAEVRGGAGLRLAAKDWASVSEDAGRPASPSAEARVSSDLAVTVRFGSPRALGQPPSRRHLGDGPWRQVSRKHFRAGASGCPGNGSSSRRRSFANILAFRGKRIKVAWRTQLGPEVAPPANVGPRGAGPRVGAAGGRAAGAVRGRRPPWLHVQRPRAHRGPARSSRDRLATLWWMQGGPSRAEAGGSRAWSPVLLPVSARRRGSI